MLKSIVKELIILLLLLIAIILLFAILLYDYNPLNKTIPEKVQAYTLPKNVEKELESTLNEEERIVKTYQIDGTDLSKFEKEDEYNPGKIAPYSLYNTTINGIIDNNEISDSPTPGTNGIFFNNPGK